MNDPKPPRIYTEPLVWHFPLCPITWKLFWSNRTPLLEIAELRCRNRSDNNFQVDHTLTVVSQAIAKFCDRYVWRPSLEIAWAPEMHIKRERGWGQAKLHNINHRTAMDQVPDLIRPGRATPSGIWCEALIRLLIIHPTNVCDVGWQDIISTLINVAKSDADIILRRQMLEN